MTELQEIGLRNQVRIWQRQQNSAGKATLFLGALTLFFVLSFLSSPGPGIVWTMFGLMAMLGACCLWMLHAASMVVKFRKMLHGPLVDDTIIDVQVMEPAPNRSRRSISWAHPTRN